MKCIIYPFSEEFLPIMENLPKVRPDIEITRLVYPVSWNLQDVPFSSSINILLSNSYEESLDDAEVVIILSCAGRPYMYEDITAKIRCALKTGHRVIFCGELREKDSTDLKEYISSGMLECPADSELEGYAEDSRFFQRQDSIIVVTANLLDNMDDTSAQCRLFSEYNNAGYDVEAVSVNPDTRLLGFKFFPFHLLDEPLSPKKKILKLNSFFCGLSDSTGADILLVHMPEGLMKYSDLCCENFGVYAYMTAQALAADYFILNTPAMDSYEPELFRELVSTVRYRFGFPVDHVLVENVITDDFGSMEDEEVRFIRLNRQAMNEILADAVAKGITLLPLNEPDTFSAIARKSIELLSEQTEGV